LTTAIGCEIQLIEQRHKELLEERAKMQRVMDVFEEYQEKMREKEEEAAKLQKEVDEMSRRPIVRAALPQLSANPKGRLSMGSGSAFKPSVEPSPAPASLHLPTLTPFQNERPPLDFSRDSTPDGLAKSPPKNDEVIDEEK
jgi:hypothetical protein